MDLRISELTPSHPQFIVERLMWLAAISFVLYLMQDTVKLSLAHYSVNRIRTVLSLVPIEEVPFPLVVIDAGEDPDPMGFVRRSQNMVGEEDVDADGKTTIV